MDGVQRGLLREEEAGGEDEAGAAQRWVAGGQWETCARGRQQRRGKLGCEGCDATHTRADTAGRCAPRNKNAAMAGRREAGPSRGSGVPAASR